MAKTKQIIHSSKKCGGLYEVHFQDDTIPYLKCDKCEHELKDWIKWEEEYKEYWKDDSKWEEKKNHITCILGYFAEHYVRHYKINYSWSLNEKGLFRGPEANILRRVYSSFDKDPATVRKYIDWNFEVKVKRKKKKITSLSFLAVPAVMNEFKILNRKNKQIHRDKKLPTGMLKWINVHAKEVEDFNMGDYGDLKHMLEIYKGGGLDSKSVECFILELKRQSIITEDCQLKNWRE